MPSEALAERVGSLEYYMKELSYQSLRTERELALLNAEMREFKDEMREFKDEMSGFKDEMSKFKDKVDRYMADSERDRRAMNRKWGELANKMGTMVEDLVAPNVPRVARELFGCEEIEDFMVRVRRKRGAGNMELDALAVCANAALINETKSNLIARDVDDIVSRLELFPQFFPEFSDRRPVAMLATLYVDESLVRYATSKGVLVMAMSDDTMQVLNPEAV